MACSSGSDHGPSGSQIFGGGSGGSAGGVSLTGSAGFSLVGSGGSNHGGGAGGAVSGYGGATAGSTASGAGGTGGMAGSAPTALDPALPTPSHDCRTDTGANCISIAGTYTGAPIDIYCNAADDLSVIVQAGKWVIGCDHLNAGYARLFVPVQKPGSFAETATAGSQPQMEFEFSVDATSSVALFGSNLVSAELAGAVVATYGGVYRAVSGTFHGSWAAPDSTCSGLYGSACAVADINVTFRIETTSGTCFSDSECPPPETCNMVGYACFN
ncbi:MAG TPA: hypothetical protein VNW92_28230 [Polyangiaceae bacterium]|nr:hypothetical protein [Polyangiaceae bacterium]